MPATDNKRHQSKSVRADPRAAILAGRVTAGMTFHQKAWAVITRIPEGKVATYGDVAAALGSPGAARAVGYAMNQNPYAPKVPCHRVVGGTGQLTGFARGLDKKRAMLEAEGVPLRGEKVDLKACRVRVEELKP